MKRAFRVILFLAIGWGFAAPCAWADENYKSLPEGADREAVYFNCSACHSIERVLQQRLNREEWDALKDWVVEENGMPESEADERDLFLDDLSTYYGTKKRGIGRIRFPLRRS